MRWFFVLLVVSSACFAHHEPVEVVSPNGVNTIIRLDHHGLQPLFIWFRSDAGLPLYPLELSSTKWVTVLTSYMLLDYVGRSFSVNVVYAGGYTRTVLFDLSSGVVDQFDPQIVEVSWLEAKAFLLRQVRQRQINEQQENILQGYN